MERVILHSDLNNFYASVECAEHPELKNRVVIICGNAKKRRGVVVAKNELAKKKGIKTGDTVWQAQKKCPDLVMVTPDLEKYRKVSQKVREIYYEFTDKVEPFGLDEAWLDVTGSVRLFGDGKQIADKIRETVKARLGLTVSIGVSFNKVFAKLGSDLKKPDATTCITYDNFKDIVWPLPIGDILYAGRATQKKLADCGITTIGALANAEPEFLERLLGKGGLMLSKYARGEDDAPVADYGHNEPVKSIGNSITLPRDVDSAEEIRRLLYILSESVCERLREKKLLTRTVTLAVRDTSLAWHDRQCALGEATMLSATVAETAFKLFCESDFVGSAVHSLGVRVSNLCEDTGDFQMNLFEDTEERERKTTLETAMDAIRKKHGHEAIGRAMLIGDDPIYKVNLKGEQIVSFPGTDSTK
ncbi:MAG: DNA polymerase IV [Clostridia bacterium]|nr:DNA polymerase IV [Clostridia bacterium]